MRYLSLGAGVQSSALLILAEQGRIKPLDVAIFADTGDEPPWVYEYLEILRSHVTSIPIERVSAGHLSARDNDRRWASIPAFTQGRFPHASPLRRQCTREFKIDPIEKHVRWRLGYQPGQRIKGKETVVCLLGISLDELQRAKPNSTPWITNTFPLIDLRLRRDDCVRVLLEAGLPEPQKSACVFCPYHSDNYWQTLKTHHPQEFAKAVEFDVRIRDSTKLGVDNPIYIHRSLKPLSEVDFDPNPNQLSLWQNECEGHCGV